MKLTIRNWRCIEDLTIELSRINVLVGRNSSGKSSVLYATYFATKAGLIGKPEPILNYMFGDGIKSVTRSDGEKAYFPVEITLDSYSVKIPDDKSKITILGVPPWEDAYLLPSHRMAFMMISEFISNAVRGLSKEALPFGFAFIDAIKKLLEELPILPSLALFLEDFLRASVGDITTYREEFRSPIGISEIVRSPLFWLTEYYVKDPFIPELKLPLSLAPEGAVDNLILSTVLSRAKKGSLIVIEEPEASKNPVFQLEMTRFIAQKALERDITVAMSTHSEIIPLALSKLVEDGMLKPRDISIYYLKRSSDNPWTVATKIEIYEDGSMDILPDSQEVTVDLF